MKFWRSTHIIAPKYIKNITNLLYDNMINIIIHNNLNYNFIISSQIIYSQSENYVKIHEKN